MQEWVPRRGCVHDPGFLADAQGLGIPIKALDDIIQNDIEPVLCGATMAALDDVYPVQAAPDWRVLITNRRGVVPSLRKIVLLRCSAR